jgi:hypothetical protein
VLRGLNLAAPVRSGQGHQDSAEQAGEDGKAGNQSWRHEWLRPSVQRDVIWLHRYQPKAVQVESNKHGDDVLSILGVQS